MHYPLGVLDAIYAHGMRSLSCLLHANRGRYAISANRAYYLVGTRNTSYLAGLACSDRAANPANTVHADNTQSSVNARYPPGVASSRRLPGCLADKGIPHGAELRSELACRRGEMCVLCGTLSVYGGFISVDHSMVFLGMSDLLTGS